MNGASDEDDILKFFSWNDPYYDHKKNQPRLSPRSGFSRHLSLFWPVSLCQPWLKIIVQNIWVIIFTKSANLLVLEVPSVRNNCLLFDTFCTIKSPIGPLNLQCIALLTPYHQVAPLLFTENPDDKALGEKFVSGRCVILNCERAVYEVKRYVTYPVKK